MPQRRSQIKKGSTTAFRERFRQHGDDKANRPRIACPYNGLMAEGWKAYFAGKPKPCRKLNVRGRAERGKPWAYYQGWTKAKLAAEQGKKSL